MSLSYRLVSHTYMSLSGSWWIREGSSSVERRKGERGQSLWGTSALCKHHSLISLPRWILAPWAERQTDLTQASLHSLCLTRFFVGKRSRLPILWMDTKKMFRIRQKEKSIWGTFGEKNLMPNLTRRFKAIQCNRGVGGNSFSSTMVWVSYYCVSEKSSYDYRNSNVFGY